MSLRRNEFNFVLEGAALIAFVLLAATGLLLEFRLTHGSGRLAVLGLARHEWGEFHFWAAASFLVLMAVHLFMHWRWVWATARGRNPATERARGAAFLVATAMIAAMIAAAMLAPVQVEPGQGDGRQHRGRAGGAAAPER